MLFYIKSREFALALYSVCFRNSSANVDICNFESKRGNVIATYLTLY